MTKPYSYQKWQTARVWPGGAWGEALAQVRKDQRLTQRDVAEYVGVPLATLRKWEDGVSLPDRSLWPKLEEAMGVLVPDPRVPDHTPAERELIDTMLLMIYEIRLLREWMADAPTVAATAPRKAEVEPKMLDVNRAASYLGVSTSFIRNLVAQRSVVHYKLGGRVMFRRDDIDRFVEQNKRERPDVAAWKLQGRRGKSPRSPVVKEQPNRSPRPRPPRMSKTEIAEKRWTIPEFGERWWGIDSATALVERAGIPVTEDATGQGIFRYGDLVSWMESHTTEFEQWLEEFDPTLKRRADDADSHR